MEAPPKIRRFLDVSFGTIILVHSTIAITSGRADEPPVTSATAGRVSLASGRQVEYALHFNRNSLRASQRVGNRLIALTTAGTLLRFDLPGFRLVKELALPSPVSCLGQGAGEVLLAGLADGRVCQVDPDSLALLDVAKVLGSPQWIGWTGARQSHPAGLVVVALLTRAVVSEGRQWDVPYSVVHDLATGRRFDQERRSTAFALDGSSRLWLGADRGEWGGEVARVDLSTGRMETIPPPAALQPDRQAFWMGILGFIALRDGQVWAFGGTSHMGSNYGEIIRVDTPEPQRLFGFEPRHELGPEPDPRLPQWPITHILEDAGGLVVVAYSDLFSADRTFKTWEKLATIELHYREGRPDAVGSYPAIQAISRSPDARSSFLLTTVGDGLLSLDHNKVAKHLLPGQLGAERASSALSITEGTLVLDRDDEIPPWILGKDGWQATNLAPPFEPVPAEMNSSWEEEKEEGEWRETHLMVGAEGELVTVSATSLTPGTRLTARRQGGTSHRVGVEVSGLLPSSYFLTDDGTIWSTSVVGGLRRLKSGQWREVAHSRTEASPYGLECVNRGGPPWILLGRDGQRLWRLDIEANDQDTRLAAVELSESGKPVAILDAIPWTDRSLLLATEQGLRSFDIVTSQLLPVDLARPSSSVTCIARDGLDRIWLGTETGLWLTGTGTQTAESLDRVPLVVGAEIRRLVVDPNHPDGIIATLGERGVAFVRVSERP